ncbi:MAG TPA: glycosyltransferase family 2 protein [Verrucomicrobiae bacterium]|nr:glycosyltransferase family 2 protein [Verrucomicrobiae bacterium]
MIAKIFALIAFRDEEQHLPGLLSHLRDYVDGFVGFDDCSLDHSAKIARGEPKMLEVLQRKTPSADHRFEIENRRDLLKTATKKGADWVLCCDADERFETRLLEDLRKLIAEPPAEVLGLPLVAVWENFHQHRVGKAKKFVLFRSEDPDPYYCPGSLHQQWFPPRYYSRSQQLLDYYIYHLGSITRADRLARYEKFNRIDPDKRHQPLGYENIIDETNVILNEIKPERSFKYA